MREFRITRTLSDDVGQTTTCFPIGFLVLGQEDGNLLLLIESVSDVALTFSMT